MDCVQRLSKLTLSLLYFPEGATSGSRDQFLSSEPARLCKPHPGLAVLGSAGRKPKAAHRALEPCHRQREHAGLPCAHECCLPKPGRRPGQPDRTITLKPKGPLAWETSRHHPERSSLWHLHLKDNDFEPGFPQFRPLNSLKEHLMLGSQGSPVQD